MYRLIYKSESTSELDWPAVEAILHASDINNRAHDISGFLLASRTHFLQVIEGTFEDVNKTFMRISRDTRHDNIQLLSYEVIDGRLFDGWGMKGIGVLDANSTLAQRLIEKYGNEQGGVRFPREAWRALAMVFDIRAIQEPPAWKR
jgi:Sensors of blue-light using FAD